MESGNHCQTQVPAIVMALEGSVQSRNQQEAKLYRLNYSRNQTGVLVYVDYPRCCSMTQIITATIIMATIMLDHPARSKIVLCLVEVRMTDE